MVLVTEASAGGRDKEKHTLGLSSRDRMCGRTKLIQNFVFVINNFLIYMKCCFARQGLHAVNDSFMTIVIQVLLLYC